MVSRNRVNSNHANRLKLHPPSSFVTRCSVFCTNKVRAPRASSRNAPPTPFSLASRQPAKNASYQTISTTAFADKAMSTDAHTVVPGCSIPLKVPNRDATSCPSFSVQIGENRTRSQSQYTILLEEYKLQYFSLTSIFSITGHTHCAGAIVPDSISFL